MKRFMRSVGIGAVVVVVAGIAVGIPIGAGIWAIDHLRTPALNIVGAVSGVATLVYFLWMLGEIASGQRQEGRK